MQPKACIMDGMSDLVKEPTITEVKQKKRELEKAIAALLDTFTNETCLAVESIHIVPLYIQQRTDPWHYSVETEVKM